jgi:hypothetical protein
MTDRGQRKKNQYEQRISTHAPRVLPKLDGGMGLP